MILLPIIVGSTILARQGSAAGGTATDQLENYCIRKFGNSYSRTEPYEDFSQSLQSSLRHDSQLVVIEKTCQKMLTATGGDGSAALLQLITQASQAPTDSHKLFKFAYACTEIAKREGKLGVQFWQTQEHRRWSQILKWLMTSPATAETHGQSSFEWLRTTFLIDSVSRSSNKLVGVGWKLLEGFPEDFQVMKSLTVLLGDERTESSTSAALRLCEEGITKWPNLATFYTAASYVYVNRWLGLGKQKADAVNDIKYAKLALQHLPQNSPGAKQTLQSIAAISKVSGE